MQTPVLFKTFNYSIVPATADTQSAEEKAVTLQQALVDVNIDFEHEDFKLEGDWQYMMAANKHAEENWFNCHNRVSIKASIYPGTTIDLTDDKNDGLVFLIEGTIKDNENTDSCSGLLVMDKIVNDNETTLNKWNLSFYLYDSAHDDCEIAFKFPVYGKPANDLLN
ncbi:MAG: hypothetical protein QM726_25565 [Chitinophagaceae bacterium]